MTEMQGAVGVAQLDKVRAVVERRMVLGELLCELIAEAPGVAAVPSGDDREISWWNFIFHVTGHDPDTFCKSVSAEGVSVGAHYIGDPIFMRGKYLTDKITYGKSGCPFTCGVTSREYEYSADMVPGALEGLRTVAVLGIHEHMDESDIQDMAKAINKVASAMS